MGERPHIVLRRPEAFQPIYRTSTGALLAVAEERSLRRRHGPHKSNMDTRSAISSHWSGLAPGQYSDDPGAVGAGEFLQALISSSDLKFQHALALLDMIAEIVADRLDSAVCATFYRRGEDSEFRLLSLLENVGLAASDSPMFEAFVSGNFNTDGELTNVYLDNHDSRLRRPPGYDEWARAHSLEQLFASHFVTGEGDRILILSLFHTEAATRIGSAAQICRLASQQLELVFSLVRQETHQRALGAFISATLELSHYDDELSDDESVGQRIADCAAQLPFVIHVSYVTNETAPALFLSAEDDCAVDVDGSESEVSALKMVSDNAMLVTLESAKTVHAILITSRKSHFGDEDLLLLRLFAGYAGATFRNHTLTRHQRRAYDALRAAQTRLIEAEATAIIGDMAGGLAHDFNNLFGAIIGRIQLIRHREGASALSTELGLLETLACEGAERIKRLQEFSSSVKPPQLMAVDAVKILHDYQARRPEWRADAERRNVTVTYSVHSPGPLTIQAKPEDLFVALDKLIRNGVDACPDDGRVEVILLREGGRAVFNVRDTGSGIPASVKNKIFNPFFTTKNTKSAGLGLSVAQGIIVNHGGSVVATSTGGAPGATVALNFPLIQATPSQPPDEVDRSRVSHRIMVVDDDEQIRGILKDMLNLLGQETQEFCDGQSTLASFAKGRYDLVFSDLGMPGMSGYELTAHLKKIDPEIPVILITGWGAQLDSSEMRSRGVSHLLAKPFHLKDLQELLGAIGTYS